MLNKRDWTAGAGGNFNRYGFLGLKDESYQRQESGEESGKGAHVSW